jgi:hypothetical protein
MDTQALLIYKHSLKVIDQTKLTENLLEKYRSCCKVIVRVNQHANFDQLCDHCITAFNFLVENPEANLPAANFIID